MTATVFHSHDHHACIEDAVEAARATCAQTGQRLTKVREGVLEILLQEHRAMGAYDVLDKLRAEGLGSQPPVAYRALDFLVANGFAHRIKRLNTFIACAHPGEEHAPAFLICRICNCVAEAPSGHMRGQLGTVARQMGFVVENAVLEAEGVCPSCHARA